MKLTLVILAAGIGSRYGGLKQMDPIGPGGEFVVDYSVFDAIRSGFNKALFVIRKDIEDAFKSTIGSRVEKQIQTEYIFQELETGVDQDVPSRASANRDILRSVIPLDRKKPWGTGHAVMICEDAVHEPFAVVNGDDFYGRDSYAVVADFLKKTANGDSQYCMVGFVLRNTLSDHGSVARGICRVASNSLLENIVETTGIAAKGGEIRRGDDVLTGGELVSMNFWGFKPSIFAQLKNDWTYFLQDKAGDPKAEFFLPTVVDKLVAGKKASVRVLETTSAWFGMTNREDRAGVVGKINRLIAAGEYPTRLWK